MMDSHHRRLHASIPPHFHAAMSRWRCIRSCSCPSPTHGFKLQTLLSDSERNRAALIHPSARTRPSHPSSIYWAMHIYSLTVQYSKDWQFTRPLSPICGQSNDSFMAARIDEHIRNRIGRRCIYRLRTSYLAERYGPAQATELHNMKR